MEKQSKYHEVIYCDECGKPQETDKDFIYIGGDEQAMHTALKPKSNKRGGSPPFGFGFRRGFLYGGLFGFILWLLVIYYSCK